MNQLITLVQTQAVEPTYEAYSLLNEDAVRAGILSALEVLNKAKMDDWFGLIDAAQTFHVHMEHYLNEELTALFHGTFIELEERRLKEGRKRYANAAK